MYWGLDSSPRELYCGGMARIIYSTGYNHCGGVWTQARMAGLFQIKEDLLDYWEGLASTQHSRFILGRDLIDYDVARHWPHP